MQNLMFDKKIGELTVGEMLILSNQMGMVKKPTLTLSEFCEIAGADYRRVKKLIMNKLYPEEMLVYGYKNYRGGKIMFYTDKVLEYLKQK